jgi:hypothetical protein
MSDSEARSRAWEYGPHHGPVSRDNIVAIRNPTRDRGENSMRPSTRTFTLAPARRPQRAHRRYTVAHGEFEVPCAVASPAGGSRSLDGERDRAPVTIHIVNGLAQAYSRVRFSLGRRGTRVLGIRSPPFVTRDFSH